MEKLKEFITINQVNNIVGSLGIAPTRDLLLFCPLWNKSDKERKIVRKKLSFMFIKRFNNFFQIWVQFRVGAIPRLPI